MQTVIIVAASSRAAAFSARRAGYAPQAIDLFADRDLAAVCPCVKISQYPGEFLSALAAAPDAPWCYGGGLENYPRLIDRLAAIRPLWGNRGDVLRRMRDPATLAEAAREAGCSFPPTQFNRTIRSNPLDGESQWLLKPRRGSGGTAIRFASYDELSSPPHGSYLQQYIEGESASAVFVAASGQARLLGVTRQLLGRDLALDRPFLYAGSIGPLPLSEQETMRLGLLGDLLAAHCRLVGLFNVDFIRTRDQIWPVEVNPRYSASIEVLEQALGATFFDLHVQACQSNALPAALEPPSRQLFSGKLIVYARQSLVVSKSLDSLIEEWNRPNQRPHLADLPRNGDRFGRHQPILTLLADGNSLADVQAVLHHRTAVIELVFVQRSDS